MPIKTNRPVHKRTYSKNYNTPPGFFGANTRRTNNVTYKTPKSVNWKNTVPPTRQKASSPAPRPLSAAPYNSSSTTSAKAIKSTKSTASAMAVKSNKAGNQPVSSSPTRSPQLTPNPPTPPPSSSPLLQTDLEIFADILSPTVSTTSSTTSKGKDIAQAEDTAPEKTGTTSSHDDPNVGLQALSETITDAGKNLKEIASWETDSPFFIALKKIVSSETDAPVFFASVASAIKGWGDRLTSLVLRLGQVEQNRIMDVVAAIDREEEMVQKHRAELEAKEQEWEEKLLEERKMWEAKLADEVRKRQDVEKMLPKQRKRGREEEEEEEEGEEGEKGEKGALKKRKTAKAKSARA
ncbi:hypothetical protein DM02DRAFT_256275 [Periconia macrospinosa]|uniref:Uncharacterized protein n=1 Tax=Periconia macrospinosa TaxID=97972 RepID=A0A2V1DYC0_9PLEO|nr:hypothetical protein DM02DRAFT_256275 [Periconia macrospinosa]